MPTMPGHAELPIGLDYNDPRPPHLDLARIEARGRRIRRRRRIGGGLALALVPALVGLAVHWAVQARPGVQRLANHPSVAAVAADAFLKMHPPNGRPILLDSSEPMWSTFGWLDSAGEFCLAAATTALPGLDGVCADAPHDLLTATTSVVYQPIFAAYPPPLAGHRHETPVAGLVRGDASTVQITMFGASTTAQAHRLPLSGAAPVEVYFAWLPVGDHTTFGTRDITDLVARDRSGRVISSVP